MTILYQGVIDMTSVDFAVEPKEVMKTIASVEAQLPGASDEFLDICRSARQLKIMRDRNEVGSTRKDLHDLNKQLTKAKKIFDNLQPLGESTICSDFGFGLDTLMAQAKSAEKKASQFVNGKQPLDHRYDLAVKLATLLKKYGKIPIAVSFIQKKKNIPVDLTYHDVFMRAVRLVDGVISERTFDYLKFGIANS